MKEEIIYLLSKIYRGLSTLKDEYFVIGSSALILLDIDLITSDIDFIMSKRDALYLKDIWKDFLYYEYESDNEATSDFFTSKYFMIFKFPFGVVEVMTDLQYRKNGKFEPITFNDFTTLNLHGMEIKVPSIQNQLQILQQIDRPKERERVRLIKEFIMGNSRFLEK